MTGWFGAPDDTRRTPVLVIGYDGRPLAPEAVAAVERADVVVGGERHLAAVQPRVGAEVIRMGPVGPAVEAVAEAYERGSAVVVLASGDPGFFGIVRRLRTARVPLTALPAVSSVATAFARLGVPWDDAVIVSAHGRPVGPALNVLRRFGRGLRGVAVLTDGDSSPAAIVRGLGESCPDLHVFERLGESDEQITAVAAVAGEGCITRDEAIARTWHQPNLVITSPLGRGYPEHPWLLGHAPGHGRFAEHAVLPDAELSHRDGMLTKQHVRATVLSLLSPRVGQLVWDVGAGSGAVAVECSRAGAAVIAVEQDADQLEHIAANVNDHQAPVEIVHGKAPEALDGLPHPDAVFVGGGGPEVVAAVAAVQPERVVVALATVERVAPTVAALGGYDVETVLLQVQHLVPLGNGHRLAPANPVFVVSGVRA